MPCEHLVVIDYFVIDNYGSEFEARIAAEDLRRRGIPARVVIRCYDGDISGY